MAFLDAVGFHIVGPQMPNYILSHNQPNELLSRPLLLFGINVSLDGIITILSKVLPFVKFLQHCVSLIFIHIEVGFFNQVQISAVFFIEDALLEPLLHRQILVVLTCKNLVLLDVIEFMVGSALGLLF